MTRLIPIGRKSAREDPTASRERQEAVVASWAKNNPDVALEAMVWENSVSGSSDWQKRGLGDVLERIRSGEADGIIVENQDRLSRGNQKQAAELWEALQEVKARLVCVADGLDTATGDHEMLFTIKGAVAREQAKQMARRTDAMKKSKIGSGVYISAIPPFGYDRDEETKKLVPNAQAPIVLELFERRASGQSYVPLCRWLDVVAPGGITGKGWAKQTLKRFFRNRAYIGEASQGDYVNPAAHPAIVDEVVFAAVQARFRHREASRPKKEEAALLSGLARCSCCGYALSRATSNGYVIYRHRTGTTCPEASSIILKNLDDYVVDQAFLEVEAEAERLAIAAPATDADAERGSIVARRDVLVLERERYQNPELLRALGPEVVLDTIRVIDADLAALEQQLLALTGDRPGFPSRLEWDALSVEDRHDALAGVLRDVLVSKAPRGTGVADRVRIIWFDEDSPVARPARGRGDVKVVAGKAAA
jgi:DNA invertase Pin-like site-specific DNA recombinase